MIWLVFVFLFLVLLYIYSIPNLWKNKNIDFVPPFPVVGNFLNTILRTEGIGEIIKKNYDGYDSSTPYFGMYFFRTPFLVIKSRELVKTVLVKDFSHFPNRPTYADEYIDPWSTKTLLTLRNEEWRSLRNKLSTVFTSGKMKMMIHLMKEVSDQMEEYLEERKSEDVDVRELSRRFFINIITKCVFGIKPNNLKDDNSYIRNLASRLIDIENYKWIFSLLLYFTFPIIVKLCGLQFVDKEAADYLVKVFEDSYKERKKTKMVTNDLVDLLHNLKEQEKEDDTFKFDDMKLAAQALVFFQAGSEPASSTLSFCLYELALNKEVQDTLREEIHQNIDADGFLSYEVLMGLTYLDLVLKEALRKYPLVQVLVRLVEKEYTFEKTGLKVEKGVSVVIPMLALHYDPKYYPDPEKFDPERFRGEKFRKLDYVYLPFGDGPRKCIGYRFAVMSLKIALAMFIKSFEVLPCTKTEIPLEFNKTSFFISPKSSSIVLRVNAVDKYKKD
ncbi:cytochrome P450 6k1-like [Harmonia axyridis]|uniref:cytochrome P450 6k1-like n=1 Tax=Harmonia axyridis TaxID=115357 RepID=UPI001E277D4F|nr:cytochrome P450 6k1-like [Harmonia axyridis]